MTQLTELKKLIRDIVGANPNLPITGVVKAIENDACTVELKGGFAISDVKLKATISEGDHYLKLVPKVGSTVLIMSLSGGLDNMAVIKVDEVEKIAYSQNGLELLIDSTDKKVSIKNDDCNLVEALTDLVTAIKQLKVFTPVGPSGAPLPNTIAALNAFETKFKKLLK